MSKNGKEEHKMPCPHNEISIVQRSHRQSAVAAAAYQSGEKLFCEYDQEVKHYPEKRGIVHNEILLPANAPLEYTDRNTLWNAAEAVEKQWNSQLARRWVLSILKNALDLYHGKVLSSADGEHWLIQFSTKYHLSYMGAVSELLKQLDSLHSYDLLNQYAMKSLTIAPDNPKAYCWLIRSLKAQGMNELATNELAAAKEHLTTEEYEEILAFGANW
jgi:hypothetical protein